LFNSKTAFIIGAGASAEVNMPVGNILKADIARRLHFSNMPPDEDVGDRFIWDAIQRQVKSEDMLGSTIMDYRNAATQIMEGMQTASSIDTYIDTHKDNNKIALCGKLAIIRSILKAERSSSLFYDINQTPNLRYSKIENTWYMNFFRILISGSEKGKERKLFENLSFIIFNYDRCFEHFLFAALMNHFQMPPVEAMKLVESIKIFHPYGPVGPKPFPADIAGDGGVPFGSPDRGNILELSENIKTFTEQLTDHTQLANIHGVIDQADKIVFLGFAFHDQNLELLQSERQLQTKKIFASAYGISDSDCRFLAPKICKAVGIRYTQDIQNFLSTESFQLLNGRKCTNIFTEFGRSMAS